MYANATLRSQLETAYLRHNQKLRILTTIFVTLASLYSLH